MVTSIIHAKFDQLIEHAACGAIIFALIVAFMLIVRRADGNGWFADDSHWEHSPLFWASLAFDISVAVAFPVAIAIETSAVPWWMNSLYCAATASVPIAVQATYAVCRFLVRLDDADYRDP